MDDLERTTLELLGFDTANPPGETRAIVDWIEGYVAELGLGAAVYARLPYAFTDRRL